MAIFGTHFERKFEHVSMYKKVNFNSSPKKTNSRTLFGPFKLGICRPTPLPPSDVAIFT